MNDLGFTEQDVKNDFERMKKGEIYWNQVRGFNNEHKWWIIKNMPNSTFLVNSDEMTDEMLKYCITHGICSFFRDVIFSVPKADNDIIKRVQKLGLTEEEWLEAIENRKVQGMFPDAMMVLAEMCTDLTLDICLAIIKRNPIMAVEKKIREIILASDKKYEVSRFIVEQRMEHDLHIQIPDDMPIDEDTWKYISTFDRVYYNEKYLFERTDCPAFLRRKAIEHNIEAWHIRDNMTADDVLYWYELYHDEINRSFFRFREFNCNDWETVVTKNPDIFKYIPKKTAKVCEIAIKANPENIKYVPKPSEKLKKLALTLDPSCKQYIEITEKTCKMMGWDSEEKTPEPYPAPYYLVTFNEDLCDEGYLNYTTVVEGKDMKKFMEQTFTVSFGNLYDDETRYVENCASVQEITKEEYDVLQKLGLTEIQSGYFDFN